VASITDHEEWSDGTIVKKGHVRSGEAGRQKCERKEINGERSYRKKVWNFMEIDTSAVISN